MEPMKQSMNPLTPLAQQLCLSPTLQINELVQKKQIEGHRIVHLGFGEATFPIQKDVLQAHRAASQQASYLPVAGLMMLREVASTTHHFEAHALLAYRLTNIYSLSRSFKVTVWESQSSRTRWWWRPGQNHCFSHFSISFKEMSCFLGRPGSVTSHKFCMLESGSSGWRQMRKTDIR